jgi:hypothetical protein
MSSSSPWHDVRQSSIPITEGWNMNKLNVKALALVGGIIGAIWGFVDGAIAGAIIAWVYNAVASKS